MKKANMSFAHSLLLLLGVVAISSLAGSLFMPILGIRSDNASCINVVDPCIRIGGDRSPADPSLSGASPVLSTRSGSPALPKVDRDVAYGTVDGVMLRMDLYYPQNTMGPAPVAVYVHGGGWVSGDKASGAGFQDVQELVNRGYLVCSVNYRLAPQYKFPAQIEDVKCAIRHIRANAKEYGADPARIGAWGGSAGGHLVSLLGLADASAGFDGSGGYFNQSSRVKAVVDMFGPTDLTSLYAGVNPQLMENVFGTTDRNGEIAKKASPVTYVSSDAPPFLILHGEQDSLVPPSQSQILYDKLRAAGASAKLVMVKNAGHGFSQVRASISPSRQEITQMIADFFDRYVRDSSSVDISLTATRTTAVPQTQVTTRKDFQQVKSIFSNLSCIVSEAGAGVLLAVGVVFVSIVAAIYVLRRRKDSRERKPQHVSKALRLLKGVFSNNSCSFTKPINGIASTLALSL